MTTSAPVEPPPLEGKLSLEQPFWEPIGRFVFNFGMLERNVDITLSVLMGTEYFTNGMYVLNPIDFLTRVHLLAVYCRQDAESLRDEVKEIALELEDCNTFRNHLVHGAWTGYFLYPDRENDAWQKMGLSRRFHPKEFTVTRSNINDKTRAVEVLREKLIGVRQRIIEARKTPPTAPAPSPGKP